MKGEAQAMAKREQGSGRGGVSGADTAAEREKRAAEALRANLRRRKGADRDKPAENSDDDEA